MRVGHAVAEVERRVVNASIEKTGGSQIGGLWPNPLSSNLLQR